MSAPIDQFLDNMTFFGLYPSREQMKLALRNVLVDMKAQGRDDYRDAIAGNWEHWMDTMPQEELAEELIRLGLSQKFKSPKKPRSPRKKCKKSETRDRHTKECRPKKSPGRKRSLSPKPVSATRKVPKDVASDFNMNTQMRGLDNRIYVVKKNASGNKYWKLVVKCPEGQKKQFGKCRSPCGPGMRRKSHSPHRCRKTKY